MTSRNRRLTQAASIKARAKEAPQDPGEFCLVAACGRLTQRAAQKGLSLDYCRKHTEHFRAHGHLTAKNFRADDLRPYRAAAVSWVRRHADTRPVREAVRELDWLLATSGRAESGKAARSRPPREKCRMQLARIRDAGKTGSQLLEAVLTSLAIVADKGPAACPDFRHMQTAKLAKRLRGASGTHIEGNSVWAAQSHYPKAQGAFMRLLGQTLEDTVRPLLDGTGAVDAVRAKATTGRARQDAL